MLGLLGLGGSTLLRLEDLLPWLGDSVKVGDGEDESDPVDELVSVL